jgi:transcriptional regulator GlxA family with amidase domain
VKRRPPIKLSPVESEIVAEIKALRASPEGEFGAALLRSPARLAYHFIHATHGNVQLRLSTIARELGTEMRSLERAFATEYSQTMAQCQVEVRLAFARTLLAIFPPTKISAIAAILGYDRAQDFNRFFKRHMRQSPSEWSRKEREKIASEQRRPSAD